MLFKDYSVQVILRLLITINTKLKKNILDESAKRPTPEALLDYAVPLMPYFAVPRFIDFVKEIPTTPTAKIQKNKLRERGLSNKAWDREAAGYKVSRG